MLIDENTRELIWAIIGGPCERVWEFVRVDDSVCESVRHHKTFPSVNTAQSYPHFISVISVRPWSWDAYFIRSRLQRTNENHASGSSLLPSLSADSRYLKVLEPTTGKPWS